MAWHVVVSSMVQPDTEWSSITPVQVDVECYNEHECGSVGPSVVNTYRSGGPECMGDRHSRPGIDIQHCIMFSFFDSSSEWLKLKTRRLALSVTRIT